MKEIFKRIITEFIEKELPEYFEREIKIETATNRVVCLIGARRTGKTSIMLNRINGLRKTIEKSKIIYINFEDDRLFPIQLENLDEIMEAYFELYPENIKEKLYLFFDEVQIIENWEKYIRRLHDTGKYEITITGSSSKLLSKEIATGLRGRSISYEIYPFSFSEILGFKKIGKNYYSEKTRSEIKSEFEKYIKNGSLPEFLKMGENERNKAIKEYNDLVIYKDISERFKAENIFLLKYLVKFLFMNNGNLISFNKIYNDFKSLGLSISRNSIYEYTSYLEEAYAVFFMQSYSENIRVQNRKPKKVYLLDTSLRMLYALNEDLGRNLENIVYLEKRRKTEQIYYMADKRELDFYLPNEEKDKLINVSYITDNPLTLKRKIESMEYFMENFGVDEGLILTNDNEFVDENKKRRIKVVPAWKYFLEMG